MPHSKVSCALIAAALTAASMFSSCSGKTENQSCSGPGLFTQVPLEYFNDSTKNVFLKGMKDAGVTVALVSLEDVFATGTERDSLMEALHDALLFFEKEGFRTGVWTNSLGYGNPRPLLDSLYPGLNMLVNFNGRTGDAVCSTDTLFLGLVRRTVQDFARAGAKFILMDDDLVQSVRPGFTCVCDNHLKLLEEATGRKYSREEVRDFFTGGPNPERTAFMEITGRTMMDFCRSLREAVDEINPEVVMSICSSYTHFDAEGVRMADLARLLAGEGHPVTFRLSGSPYWPVIAPRFPGQTLGDVCDFVRMQIGWYRGSGIALFDENDPYPRDSKIVPPEYCEIYDKVMLANGGVHRHKYMFCDDPKHPDKAYLEAHLADMEDDAVLIDMFKDKTPCGFRIWKSEHILRETSFPDEYAGDSPMMVRSSHSSAAVFMTSRNIPVCFEGSGFPGIVFGDQARLIPEEAVGDGLILDAPAALALMSIGINVGLDPAVMEGGKSIPPYSRTETEDGRFVIYGLDGDSMLFNGDGDCPVTMQQIEEDYRFLSGGKNMPVCVTGSESKGIYTVATRSEDGGSMSILLCNTSADDCPAPALSLDGEGWKVARSLRTEAVMRNTDGLHTDRIPALGWCAVELVKEAPVGKK